MHLNSCMLYFGALFGDYTKYCVAHTVSTAFCRIYLKCKLFSPFTPSRVEGRCLTSKRCQKRQNHSVHLKVIFQARLHGLAFLSSVFFPLFFLLLMMTVFSAESSLKLLSLKKKITNRLHLPNLHPLLFTFLATPPITSLTSAILAQARCSYA